MQPFPMSPRNSPDAVVHMLEQTSCHYIITQASLMPLVSAVRDRCNSKDFVVHVEDLPDIYEMFPTLKNPNGPSSYTPYPAVDDDHSKDDVALYIHSSGSTGFPKPIPQTQTTMLEWCHCGVLSSSHEHRMQG